MLNPEHDKILVPMGGILSEWFQQVIGEAGLELVLGKDNEQMHPELPTYFVLHKGTER